MATRRPRTSCEPCRTARLGCDAASRRPSMCSNCVRRGKCCNSQPSLASGQAYPRSPADSSPGSFGLENLASRRVQANLLNELLWDVYASVFEVRFAIWLGDSCCPYLELKTPKPKASITRLILQIDAYDAIHRPTSNVYQGDLSASLAPSPSANQQRLFSDALRNAIYAYAIRWLPLRAAYEDGHGRSEYASERQQAVRDQLWYWAKESIVPVLTRPSYRSILALLLFTLTEPPKDLDDPGFIRLCNQALFGHVHDLRNPMRWRVKSSMSTLSYGVASHGAPDHPLVEGQRTQFADQHKHSRDQIFWLFVVCSCSRGLIQQLPTSAVSQGLGDRELWDYIRQRTNIFDQSFRVLRNSATPLPQDVAEVVLQHASACKTMYLALINQASFSLVQEDADARNSALQSLADESQRFHDVFDHLLAMCARDYIMLSPPCQLNYLLLTCHYHLGTLLLTDTLLASTSTDTSTSRTCPTTPQTTPATAPTPTPTPAPLPTEPFSRLHALQAIISALTLALNTSRYSLPFHSHSHSHPSPSRSTHTSVTPTHILLLDPAPELMVEVLLRAANALLALHAAAHLAPHAAGAMLAVLLGALEVLSRVSRNAGVVRRVLVRLGVARGLCVAEAEEHREGGGEWERERGRAYCFNMEGNGEGERVWRRGGSGGVEAQAVAAALVAACNGEGLEEFRREMEGQAAGDRGYLEGIVEGLERRSGEKGMR